MTRAELEAALEQQRTENDALRAELAAQCRLHGIAPFVPGSLSASVFEGIRSAVVQCGTDGRVQWVNDGFMALCGLDIEAVRGQKLAAFLRPSQQAPALEAYMQDCLNRQLPFQYEVPNPRPGSGGWLRVRTQPVSTAATGEVYLMALLEDITEWKQAQMGLVESEKRFRDLAENVPGVLYEWRKNVDGTFQFDYTSPKVLELFGVHPHELGRMMEFIHPDDLERFQLQLDTATRNRAPWQFEGRLVVPGQPLRWMRGSAILTGSGPTWVRYSGLLLDITPLKQAQAALRERDLRLSLAIEGFGDGTWELHLRTNQLTYSLEYKAMLGYADEEFADTYEKWISHVHPADQAVVLDLVHQHLSSNAPSIAHEFRIRCKDGSYKWVLVRAAVTERDEYHKPLILSGLNTDISARKKAEEELAASTRRLSAVIANFQDGLVLEDEDRHIVLTNEAFCRMLSETLVPKQLTSKDGAWLEHETQAYMKAPAQYLARIATVLAARMPVHGDTIETLDGRVIQRDFTPVYDHRRYIGHLWKFQDVTVRAKAEEELRYREEKYRGIIESMSLGLVEADLKDHLLYANQSFCDMTGYCNEELTGQYLSRMLLSGDSLALAESKMAVREQGIADSYEIVINTKSGEQKWLLVSGAPLYDDARQLTGSIGIYLDVTPQKMLEASLREAKAQAEVSTRAKQDFLANMSHEIRTPMNAILGMSQLLAKTPLTSPQASYLHAISASAENLLVIINDILDLSKIEAGRITIERIGFSLTQVCSQVEKTLHLKAEEKGLNFSVSIGPDVPPVLLGDPYRITQILLNLAGNAVKFTEKGHVRVSCTLLEPATAGAAVVAFAVQDTGIGIEAGYLAQIFDDYSQEDSSVTRQFGGTGLGLGISRKLVALLGGELRINSQKSQGTTSHFALRLPLGTTQDVPSRQESALRGLQFALRGKRVLLVEDNAFNRMLATIFLTNSGIMVTEAANGLIAVELARTQAFDLILMDVQMPVMNGYEATTLLRRQFGPTVPIIALTANAITGEREKCLVAGMNDYLTKPFQEATLMRMVHDWTVHKRPAG